MLDASVQIFMIIERVVVEVYSRKRISLRIASYVSHQLKGWAANWLSPLNNVILGSASNTKARQTVVGACQTLCSYYYGIMLLTRPFLIYELYEYLGASMRTSSTRSDHLEKEKFADAALDAAVAFVDTLDRVVTTKKLPRSRASNRAWPSSWPVTASHRGPCKRSRMAVWSKKRRALSGCRCRTSSTR